MKEIKKRLSFLPKYEKNFFSLKKNISNLYKNNKGKSLRGQSVGILCEKEFQNFMKEHNFVFTFNAEMHIKNEDNSYVKINMYELKKIIVDEVKINHEKYPHLNKLSDNQIREGFDAFRWYLSNSAIIQHFGGGDEKGLKITRNVDIYDTFEDYYNTIESKN